jgi:hypothetical protein
MGVHWPACGKAIDACPDIGSRNDVVAIHEFPPKDIRHISELLDLKLVLWFTDSTKQTDRFLKLMNIISTQMHCYPETSVFTTVYLSLLESEATRIFVCGKQYKDKTPNSRIFHENQDMRVECASHVGMMSIKI